MADRHRPLPVRINSSVIDELRRLAPLAPLHQPNNLAAIVAISRLHPELPQVACFDTAFHCTQSEITTAFALPHSITAQGVRRYGFHGLSYEYIAGVLPEVLGPAIAEGRIVVAHLGSGASMCAPPASKRGNDHEIHHARWSCDGYPKRQPRSGCDSTCYKRKG